MKALACLLANKTTAWAIVVVVGLLTVASLGLARKLKHEDDILAFLPQDNPEVRGFTDINKLFGGLDVALVGIESEDPLAPHFLDKLGQLTRELKELQGLSHVLSLTNIVDFVPDKTGGIITGPLVDKLPRTPAEQAALKAKVFSRDHVVGNLIAPNGKGVLVYCFIGYGTDTRSMASQIQAVVRSTFPDQRVYWGGNPFISTYIYNTTQEDLRRLTPWAALAIVVIMMITFREVIATFLALFATGIGVVIALGLMAALKVPFNIVLGSMPIVMLALGSAYAIHVLARYYTLSQEEPPAQALTDTITSVGPTVLAAGLTTAASLLSFIFMDIQPLRVFGLFTAIGLLVMLALALLFIPAVIRLGNLRGTSNSSPLLRQLLVRLTVFAYRRRWGVRVALALVALAGLAWIGQVDSRMDQGSFFTPGSPPDLAERYLQEQFGGSQFIQLRFRGDMTDPAVLRELQRAADELAVLPHVTSSQHIAQAIAMVNEAMTGQRRIPDSQDQVQLLYPFLASDASVGQLITDDRQQALLHLKIDSNRPDDYEAVLAQVERWVEQNLHTRYTLVELQGQVPPPLRRRAQTKRDQLVLARIHAAAHQRSLELNAAALTRLRRGLHAPAPALDPEPVREAVQRFLRSEECVVALPPAENGQDPARTIAARLAALGPAAQDHQLSDVLAKALARPADDPLVQDLAFSVSTPLQEIWDSLRARLRAQALLHQAGIELPAGDRGQRLLAQVTWALLELNAPAVLLPAAAPDTSGAAPPTLAAVTLTHEVSGLPVMNRGLSRSVTANQIKSLSFAFALVLVIMAVLFRSIWTGLLVSSPSVLTLLVIYGGMGLWNIRLDIGTSMLASIILGAGVDYAVHLVAAWRAPADGGLAEAAARAADRTGLAIWTNAIMVGVGFFILTLGQARPLKNVGGLTAAAMITAALATFFAIPALARRRTYRRPTHAEAVLDDSETSQVAVGKAHQ